MPPSSLLLLDPLYCQEDHWDVVDQEYHDLTPRVHHDQYPDLENWEEGEEWDQLLSSLLAKEAAEQHLHRALPAADDDPYVFVARRDAVRWAARAAAWHGFGAPSIVLAARYLDGCFLPGGAGLCLRPDRPWMPRLAAVACLSLAAKVEETRVPLLPDLQFAPEDDGGYVFDAKTVRRMELLVLSALGWRMSPVTPLSFIHQLLPKIINKCNASAAHVRDVLTSCHSLLLAVIDDWRWICYPPSVLASAALLHAMGKGNGSLDCYQETLHHLLGLLNVPKERVEECYLLIEEAMAASGDGGAGNKRKHPSSCCHSYDYYLSNPSSPNGVIGSCFSCESSSFSGEPLAAMRWPSSVSSSPEHPPLKKPNCIATDSIETDDDGQTVANLHHLLS